MMLSLLAPGGLYLLRQPWSSAYVATQTLLWLTVLVVLLRSAASERFAFADGHTAAPAGPPAPRC